MNNVLVVGGSNIRVLHINCRTKIKVCLVDIFVWGGGGDGGFKYCSNNMVTKTVMLVEFSCYKLAQIQLIFEMLRIKLNLESFCKKPQTFLAQISSYPLTFDLEKTIGFTSKCLKGSQTTISE